MPDAFQYVSTAVCEYRCNPHEYRQGGSLLVHQPSFPCLRCFGISLTYAAAFDTTPSYILMNTDFPDNKNYEVEQLGLTCGAVRNICTQKFNMEVLNRLLEDPLFADLTKMIYVDSLVKSRLSRNVHDKNHMIWLSDDNSAENEENYIII